MVIRRECLPVLALIPLIIAVGCGGGLYSRPPVHTLDLSKALIVRVESEPEGAAVYETDPKGGPPVFLGTTPLEWAPFEIEKDEWKFDPSTDFVESESALDPTAVEQHIVVRDNDSGWTASRGEEVCLDLLVTAASHKPARLIRCLRAKELPALWKNPTMTLRARLAVKEEDSARSEHGER